MLQNLDLNKKLKKGEFTKQLPDLRTQLGELQRKLRRAQIPVIILFEGWEPALMSKVINQLLVPLVREDLTIIILDLQVQKSLSILFFGGFG